MVLKRFFQSALALAVVAMAVAVTQAPAHAAGEVYGPYFLVDADTFFSDSAQCIDNPNFNANNNVRMDIYKCLGSTNEQWYNETPVSGNDFWTFNASSRKCLTVQNASKTSGASIIQYSCTTGTNERWTYPVVSSGEYYETQIGSKRYWTTNPEYEIKNVNSGMCLSVQNGGVTSGTPLLQLSCSNSVSHYWLQFPVANVVS